MNIVCIVILATIIIIGLVLKSEIYSPEILISITFLVLFILQSFQFYGLYSADDNSYLICLLGICSFCLGCMIKRMFKSDVVNLRNDKNEIISDQINAHRKALLCLLFIAFFMVFAYSWKSIAFLRSGGSLYDMRYSQQDILHSSGIISFLYTYIGVPIIYFSLPISIYDYLILGNKKYFLLTLITVFFWFIGNGARLPLIYCVLNIVCTFLLFYPELRSSGKVKKIIIMLILFFLIIDILSWARKSGKNIASDNTTFIQGLYYYLGGSMINMSSKLHFVATKESLLGVMTFYGLFLPISNIFNIDLFDKAAYFPDMVQNNVIQISSQSIQTYNFGTTGFLYLYADGKILGIIIISLLFGFVSQLIYEKCMGSLNLKYYVLYSLIMEAILMFTLTDLLSNISFAFAIIYTLLFINSYKVKNR